MWKMFVSPVPKSHVSILCVSITDLLQKDEYQTLSTSYMQILTLIHNDSEAFADVLCLCHYLFLVVHKAN